MIVDSGRSAWPGVIVVVVVEETLIGCYNEP
jgi:hypothetical protein